MLVQPGEMIPHCTYIQAIKQVISWLLVLHEKLEVFEHSSLNLYLVLVTDWIFTEEVKLHNILSAVLLLVQGDVLHTQWAAAHCVCLILIFFVPSSQG